ncbi:MAG: hypothetical protein PHE24_02675 [Patescibacteria group bacterium]|nr:hypothetical protein [Patescibacteria group bacterium]
MNKNFPKILLVSFFCLLCLALNFNLFPWARVGAMKEGVFSAYASTSAYLETSVKILLVCGDGFIDPYYEFCDPGNPSRGILSNTGTTTCQSFIDIYTGLPFVSGRLACTSDCTAYSTSTCYTCGDLHKQQAEECDNLDFGGADCKSFGYTTGTLHCTPNCRLDLSNCSVVGNQEPQPGQLPTTGGGGGGSSGGTSGFVPGTKTPPDQTLVVINGNGYPNREVRVLIDGNVAGIVRADSKGDFHFQSGDTTPGVSSFGLWTDDERGLKSTLLTLTFRVASKSITTIENVYLSPTIDVNKNQVNKGESIKIFGKSSPTVNIAVHVNSDLERVSTTTSGAEGDWSLVFNTAPLTEDFHTAKALIHLNSPTGVIESNFSRSVSFYVGKNVPEKGKCGIADLNCDNAVNLVDFSILLYNWDTSDQTADINKDGKVGLADFSIMMYYWTG